MLLSFVDWSIIIAFFVISLGIGVYVSKKKC
jgi:predicted membrane-bound spermidine synthase